MTAITTTPRQRQRSPLELISLVGHDFRFELLSFLRNQQALFFTMLLPIVFLVIFIALFGNGTVVLPSGAAIKTSTFYVPGLTAMGIIQAAFANLVVAVVVQRESGILKRRRAAPVPAWVIIMGRALMAIVVALFMCGLLLAVGAVFYGVSLPTSTIPAVAVTAVLGAVAFCCVGYGVTSFIGSAESANPLVQLTLLPLYFISGVFVPQSEVPAWLSSIANVFPVRHLSDALVTAFDPRTVGAGFSTGDLLVLAAWAAGGLLVALVRFSWAPRAR